MDSPDSVIGLYELYTNAICRQTAVLVWSHAGRNNRNGRRSHYNIAWHSRSVADYLTALYPVQT